MVQALQVKGKAQAVVWGEAKAEVEAEWEGRLQQDRVEVVYARNAQQ